MVAIAWHRIINLPSYYPLSEEDPYWVLVEMWNVKDKRRVCTVLPQRYVSFKVAYTSDPFFEKIMKRYPIFSLQINYHQIGQRHK